MCISVHRFLYRSISHRFSTNSFLRGIRTRVSRPETDPIFASILEKIDKRKKSGTHTMEFHGGSARNFCPQTSSLEILETRGDDAASSPNTVKYSILDTRGLWIIDIYRLCSGVCRVANSIPPQILNKQIYSSRKGEEGRGVVPFVWEAFIRPSPSLQFPLNFTLYTAFVPPLVSHFITMHTGRATKLAPGYFSRAG